MNTVGIKAIPAVGKAQASIGRPSRERAGSKRAKGQASADQAITDLEIEYLRNIGNWRCNETKRSVSVERKIILLERYLEHARHVRVKWDGIDRETVIEFTQAQLDGLRGF